MGGLGRGVGAVRAGRTKLKRCESCGKPFDPRFTGHRYCSRECYETERRFLERLRFDQHRIWDWNRIGAAIALAVALLAGCKPRPAAQIPEPVGSNTYLVYDGEKLVWRELVGGPSGAIDTVSHPGEIELIPAATAKYLRSPVTYASEPAEGQLVVYGPKGSSDQAVTASGLSAEVLGIENGILVPGKLPPPPAPQQPGRAILGWTGDSYVQAGARVFLTFGSLTPAGGSNRMFAMPAGGRITGMTVATRTLQPSSGPLAVTLARGGAAIEPGLRVTVPEGAPAGVRHATGSVEVAPGDLVGVEVVNSASGNSAYLNSVSVVFEF